MACACAGLGLVGCGSSQEGPTTAARTAPTRAPAGPVVLASAGVGRIRADCSDPERALFALEGDAHTPSEWVVARVGTRRAQRQVYAGSPELRITAPMRRQRSGGGRFAFETPMVRWTIRQSNEPATVRARAELRVTNRVGRCVVTHADLHLTSRSHGG